MTFCVLYVVDDGEGDGNRDENGNPVERAHILNAGSGNFYGSTPPPHHILVDQTGGCSCRFCPVVLIILFYCTSIALFVSRPIPEDHKIF